MKKLPHLHTFLLALLPVIFLYSHNTSLILLSEMYRPLLIILGCTVLLLFLFRFLFKTMTKAAVALSFLIVFFFAYGHIHALLPDFRWHLGSIILYPNTVLLPLWAFLLVSTLLFIRFSKNKFQSTGKFLTVVSLLLIFSSLVTTLSAKLFDSSVDLSSRINKIDTSGVESYPDIYYIILDGYSGNDILTTRFKYDNSSFTDSLTSKGFSVIQNARSNYCQTLLSVSSSLNFQYHDSLAVQLGFDSEDRKTLINLIKKNKTMGLFKQFGYKTIALASGYYGTEITNADEYLTMKQTFSEFEEILMHSTPIPVIMRKMKSSQLHVERIRYNFKMLQSNQMKAAPKFVFAHFICPHPPFLFTRDNLSEAVNVSQVFTFGKNGAWPEGNQNEKKYIKQIQFVNKQILQVIDSLSSDSSREKIIILQSDHGSLFPRNPLTDSLFYNEKFSILTAISLPDTDNETVPDNLTPVNIFRFIFNNYFHQDYPLLPNRHLYSTWQKPFNFTEKTAP